MSRLIRVRYGVVEMPRLLKTGYFDELPDEERDALLASVQWVNPATPPSDSVERVTAPLPDARKNNSRREARQTPSRGRPGQGRRTVRD